MMLSTFLIDARPSKSNSLATTSQPLTAMKCPSASNCIKVECAIASNLVDVKMQYIDWGSDGGVDEQIKCSNVCNETSSFISGEIVMVLPAAVSTSRGSDAGFNLNT